MSKKKGTLHLVDPDAPVEESDDREYFELTDIREMVERGFGLRTERFSSTRRFEAVSRSPESGSRRRRPPRISWRAAATGWRGMGPHFRYVGPALAEEE